MARLEPLKPDEMSEDQKIIADEIIASRGEIAGPFIPWLRNAELADSNKKLGSFCRFNTSLSPRLSEFIILIVAFVHQFCVFVVPYLHAVVVSDVILAQGVFK